MEVRTRKINCRLSFVDIRSIAFAWRKSVFLYLCTAIFFETLTCLADKMSLLRHAIFCVDGKESVSLSKQIHPFLF